MNELMKRRLIGALVLLLMALGLAFLLPEPGPGRREDGVRRVTIDLQNPQAERVVEGDRVMPPVIAAPPPTETAMAESSAAFEPEPEIEEPGYDAGDNRLATAPVTIKPSESLAQAAPGQSPMPAPVAKAPPVQLKQADSLHDFPGMEPVAPAAVPPPPKPARPAPALPPVAAAQPPKAPVAEVAPPKPAAPRPVPPKPVVTPPPAPAPAATGKIRWSVQVGSFAEIGNARIAESKLKAAGLPTQFGPVDTAKGVLYRVRVGPLADEAAAASARAKALQLGFAQATVRKD